MARLVLFLFLVLSVTLVTGLALSTAVITQPAQAAESADHEANISSIKSRLAEILDIVEIIPVAETGFYRLKTSDGRHVFTDKHANGFFVGDVFSHEGGRFINQSEAMLNKERFATIQKIPVSDTIVFPAEGKKMGDMYVFTDIDCGYCRRLHDEISLYQKSGIEVRYIAWPRCGVGPQCVSYEKAVNVWCAEDRQQAMTDAKAGKRVPSAQCSNPVADQFELGRQIGLRGTPFIMLSNGTAIPGYQSAGEIAKLF